MFVALLQAWLPTCARAAVLTRMHLWQLLLGASNHLHHASPPAHLNTATLDTAPGKCCWAEHLVHMPCQQSWRCMLLHLSTPLAAMTDGLPAQAVCWVHVSCCLPTKCLSTHLESDDFGLH